MSVDFSKRQRRYLPVKLKNGVRLEVEEPTMQIFQNLQAVHETDKVKDLTEAVKTILNRNKQKRKFNSNEVAAMFTLNDMVYFLEAYADFAMGIKNDPN